MDKKTRDIRLNAANRVKGEAQAALAKAQERQKAAEKAVKKADAQIAWLKAAPLDDEDDDEEATEDQAEAVETEATEAVEAATEETAPAVEDTGSQGFLDDAPAPTPSRSRRGRSTASE